MKLPIFQALREKEAVLESLADRELTIVKFRELVHKLQEQITDMRLQLQKESTNKATVATVIPEMLDFKVSIFISVRFYFFICHFSVFKMIFNYIVVIK